MRSAVALILLTASISSAQADTQNFCYQTIYSEEHMHANPGQKVRAFKLNFVNDYDAQTLTAFVQVDWRSNGQRAVLSNGGRCTRHEVGEVNVTLKCEFKDGGGNYDLTITPHGVQVRITDQLSFRLGSPEDIEGKPTINLRSASANGSFDLGHARSRHDCNMMPSSL